MRGAPLQYDEFGSCNLELQRRKTGSVRRGVAPNTLFPPRDTPFAVRSLVMVSYCSLFAGDYGFAPFCPVAGTWNAE